MSESLNARIDTTLTTRAGITTAATHILETLPDASELAISQAIQQAITEDQALHDQGWYNPPPAGIGILFAEATSPARLSYDSLRNESNWPQSDSFRTQETVGFVYASPVHKATGMIGDFGFTFYQGQDEAVQKHMVNCLEALEVAAGYAAVGMAFRDLHAATQDEFEKRQLHNDRMITFNDPLGGTNLGHTVPWTYETPTQEEQAIIDKADLNVLKDVIAHKRLYINHGETFTIPENIIFTLEARLESKSEPKLPSIYYHIMVVFKDGAKTLVCNFNPVFESLGMDFIRSKNE